MGLCLSKCSWSMPTAVAARHAAGARGHGLSVLSPNAGLVPGGRLTLQSSTGNCRSLPWGGSICPALRRPGAEPYLRR